VIISQAVADVAGIFRPPGEEICREVTDRMIVPQSGQPDTGQVGRDTIEAVRSRAVLNSV